MAKRNTSAGLLMFRRSRQGIEVFLVHPGGPFFARKDEGVWSLPKGEVEDGEAPLSVAHREFLEETGTAVAACASDDDRIALGSVVQRGGKTVLGWAFEGDWPADAVFESNTFPLEWPPRSGRYVDTPEVDRGEFFPLDVARRKINQAQSEFFDRLLAHLEG